ncbi:PEP/pyruvate-binding domain-containing protein [Epilithonimonas sp. JDS]|uniref:PEP/pyruvate-binding domain-containing protein n=1 Tax=Epilithonimonas sp. JDS TaxID=2902797 RepID=UPI001E3689EA|nr:PEP/pyruvate-binding domain-containing protein [Epilithonimonas sp. JDS]MCD9855706.1 PEP/pyruvate-binding domain-containing protein [Epilithonimonas sp. JDS]
MKKLIILFYFLASAFFFAQKDFVNSITQKQQFINLAGKPLTDKFTNIKSVKVVYDYSDKKIYFFNSIKYKYHHDFCEEVLGFSKDLGSFNDASYNATNDRAFLLGNLNYIEKSDDWVLELAASDQMNAKLIEFFFSQVKKNVFFGSKVKFYLSTPRLIALNQKQPLKIPIVYSDFIFQNLTEQSVEKGSAIGILKKYDLKSNPKFYPKENEIIIINSTPEIIPNVKAIIVTEFQTPLSHLVLLAKNRNIPLYVDTEVFGKTKINNLIDKKVELIVTDDNYKIALTSKPIKLTKAKPRITLVKNLEVKDLIDLNKTLPANPQNIIGSKATNLGLLKIVEKEVKAFKTPEFAYGIPFYYYDEHIKNNHFDKEISEVLALPKDSIRLIDEKLKAIRKTIKKSKVDPELIALITNTLSQQNQFKNFKFRSSTNAEDLAGFNGAGLYDSKSAILGDSVKTVEKAILDVWASFWNERAFHERDIFNIDHLSCAMGILVHRSFPDELANGVLITKNIYRKEYQGITVNVQKGEESVVKPEIGVTCDEFYVHNFNFLDNKLSVDYRSTSSLNDKKPILKTSEIETLFKISPKIEGKMYTLWKKYKIANKPMPLDIEFKIVGENRTLYIKQARAYMD